MKNENLYYAVFALLVIIFCAITAMRVFAATLHVGAAEEKQHSDVGISKSLTAAFKTNEAALIVL